MTAFTIVADNPDKTALRGGTARKNTIPRTRPGAFQR